MFNGELNTFFYTRKMLGIKADESSVSVLQEVLGMIMEDIQSHKESHPGSSFIITPS
jgi:hypothetical protein